MRDDQRPGRAENYTTAFLVTCGVILFMLLWVVASLGGTLAMLLFAAACDQALRFAQKRRTR